jgi:hypothetical protein
MVPISRSGHLKILGSTKEALSTAAVAADPCAPFAARRHRSGEPIATLCGNDDIPECRSDAGEVQENVNHPRNSSAYTKV